MCRITGLWSTHGHLRDHEIKNSCKKMLDTLEHGGPDDSGFFFALNNTVALGHRRLSIIDLSSTGHQPITSYDGRYVLSYNGEVYNYRELKHELEGLGVVFKGSSDAEVVVNSFSAWGRRCVKRFIGMFAFALWDSYEKELYLFRDRLGVKPLYYYAKNGVFAFASELKAINAGFSNELKTDQASQAEFFRFGYISAPASIYKNVNKLEPGCWLKVRDGIVVEKNRYWSRYDALAGPEITGSLDDAADELEELLVDSFKKRLVADVPVGVFLSGGIDSSLVTAVLAKHCTQKIKTFTIGFNEKKYDESAWAGKIAGYLNTEHTMWRIGVDDAIGVIKKWPTLFDEPFADLSGIPTFLVSGLTRQHVKVSLSADGGDEFFCGYSLYGRMMKLSKYFAFLPVPVVRNIGKWLIDQCSLGRKTKLDHLLSSVCSINLKSSGDGLTDGAGFLQMERSKLRKLGTVMLNWDKSKANAYAHLVSYFSPEEVARLTGCNLADTTARSEWVDRSENLLDSLMSWDIDHYLPDDILTKVDRTTMYHGLEGREPLLDHRIAEFSMRLPLKYKYNNGIQKVILKKILGRYLPETFFNRPKQGFAVPLNFWLANGLESMVDSLTSLEFRQKKSLYDHEMVKNIVAEFRQGHGDLAAYRLWLILAGSGLRF